MIYKTLHRKPKDRSPLKTGDELGCTGQRSSSWSTCGTGIVALVKLPVVQKKM